MITVTTTSKVTLVCIFDYFCSVIYWIVKIFFNITVTSLADMFYWKIIPTCVSFSANAEVEVHFNWAKASPSLTHALGFYIIFSNKLTFEWSVSTQFVRNVSFVGIYSIQITIPMSILYYDSIQSCISLDVSVASSICPCWPPITLPPPIFPLPLASGV